MQWGYKSLLPIISILVLIIVLFAWPRDDKNIKNSDAQNISNNKKHHHDGTQRFFPSKRKRDKIVKERKAGDLPEISKWIKASESDDIDQCREAAEMLGESEAPEAAPYLIKLCSHKDVNIKWTAIRSLGKIKGYYPSIEALARICQNTEESDETRKEAVTSLGRLGDTKSLPVFLEILENSKNCEELRSEEIGRASCRERV